MAKTKKILPVKERKLGREYAFGQVHENGLIEIDPRQSPKSYLDTLVHEALHIACPELSERQVLKRAKIIRDILWDNNYRKVKQ